MQAITKTMKTMGFLLVGFLAFACNAGAITIDFTEGAVGSSVAYSDVGGDNLYHSANSDFSDGRGAVAFNSSKYSRVSFFSLASVALLDVITWGGGSLTFSAFDIAGQVIKTETLAFNGASPISFEASGRIQWIDISGAPFGLDAITYTKAPRTVPDGGVPLVAMAGVMVGLLCAHRLPAFPRKPALPRVPVL